MAVMSASEAYYDPYGVEINADPYPVYRRLREEAPLYYNEPYNFFALSRYADVERGLVDKDTYSSARGDILEMVSANVEAPPGIFIWEDPPIHSLHRGLMSRVFTPKKMNALEGRVREFCALSLDPLVGAGRFDFVGDLGAQMPMRTIGMLLGIPEEDQEAVRRRADAALRTEPGKPMDYSATERLAEGDMFGAFADYIDWRAEHPSDDIMTDLLNVEFTDEKDVTRRLTREELLTYISVVSGAGNETTTRLIGWAGKVLAEHPDQRRELAENPALIPAAIEELLRFEPPAPHVARYVTRDIIYYGQTVPEGSAMMMLIGSANRDHRQFPPDGDVFDIHREPRQHLSFSVGT
ncbi:MAG: cytochrome P450, partial [Acidimicrobiales bacterium]